MHEVFEVFEKIEDSAEASRRCNLTNYENVSSHAIDVNPDYKLDLTEDCFRSCAE